jgi:hypothetical protein
VTKNELYKYPKIIFISIITVLSRRNYEIRLSVHGWANKESFTEASQRCIHKSGKDSLSMERTELYGLP